MIVVQIAGRLGRDAETRFTPSGQKLTTLAVATNVRKAGKDETVWWRVTIWGDRYDKMTPYFKKGTALVIVGEMNKPEIWTDKEGKPNIGLEMTAEIVRFSPFGGTGERSSQEAGASGSHQSSSMNTPSQQNHSNYSSPNNHSHNNFGHQSDDFGASMQSGSNFSHASHDEEPLPF